MLETFADFATGHHRIGNVHNRALRNSEVMEHHLAMGECAYKKVGNANIRSKNRMYGHADYFIEIFI